MVMGRKRKYNTPEEKKAADKEKALRYYWANKEICDKRARERYWMRKTGNTNTTSSVEPEKVTEPMDAMIEDAK